MEAMSELTTPAGMSAGVSFVPVKAGEDRGRKTLSIDAIILDCDLCVMTHKTVELNNPVYKPAAVARAAGIPLTQLRNWERSERALINRQDGERWFTFRRALQVGIAAALIEGGIKTDIAIVAAGCFTDIGDGERPGQPARDPGVLFDDGMTVLCVFAGGESDVKQVLPNTPAGGLFFPFGKTKATAVTMLDLTRFVADFWVQLTAEAA